MASTDAESILVWALRGAKRAYLYIDLLEYVIDLLEYVIDLLKFIIGLPESIGPLEYTIGQLECIIGLPESKGPLEYTIGQLECIGPLEYTIGQLDSRETDHAEVLEVPWSHDMLVAANSHRVTIDTASVSVEDNLSRGSLLDHGKARFQVCNTLNQRYPLIKQTRPNQPQIA